MILQIDDIFNLFVKKIKKNDLMLAQIFTLSYILLFLLTLELSYNS